MGTTPECEITSEGVTIRVLGFPKRIPFYDIKKIEKASYGKAALESMNPFKPAMCGLWNMSLFGVVLIETKDQRRWVISPKNRDEFINSVLKHLPISGQDSSDGPVEDATVRYLAKEVESRGLVAQVADHPERGGASVPDAPLVPK
jgi:hypothetical protein